MNIRNEKEFKKFCEKKNWDFNGAIAEIEEQKAHQGEGSWYLDQKGKTVLEPLNNPFSYYYEEYKGTNIIPKSLYIEIVKPGICDWDYEDDCMDQVIEEPVYHIYCID